MRMLRYLNTVLTLIAILLTLNLWTLWFATPSSALVLPTEDAYALSVTGMPNAAQQRRDHTEQLKKLNGQMSDLKGLLASGKVRVRLEAGSSRKN